MREPLPSPPSVPRFGLQQKEHRLSADALSVLPWLILGYVGLPIPFGIIRGVVILSVIARKIAVSLVMA